MSELQPPHHHVPSHQTLATHTFSTDSRFAMNVALSTARASLDAVGTILSTLRSGDLIVQNKADGSVVTNADYASHTFLSESLRSILDVPVISEEGIPPFEVRRGWNHFWLIDPLDNTKAFVEGKLEDARVFISLIKDNTPILGVVTSVGTGDALVGVPGIGVFDSRGDSLEPRDPLPSAPQERRFATYRPDLASMSRETREALKSLGATNSTLVFSPTMAGKLLSIIEGRAEVLVESRRISAWDLAAFVACISAGGGRAVPLRTEEPLDYNSPSMRLAPLMMGRL